MNILEKIADGRRIDTEKRKEKKSLDSVRQEAELIAEKEIERDGQFRYPFRERISAPGISFICEVKKASPSKGLIAENFPYLQIAAEYEEAGAAAISVLTEPDYFMGSDEYLRQIASERNIPVLRKDFTVDEYQIYEAKILGASAVLLICAILDDNELKTFLETAHRLGLSALVEAHDEEEVRRAVAAGAGIIGVNNRDLKTFTVDINNSIKLRELVPDGVVFVSESGIRNKEDVENLKKNGTDAVLIGETLMRADDKKAMLSELAGK